MRGSVLVVDDDEDISRLIDAAAGAVESTQVPSELSAGATG
jgi:hypothetical protein